MIFFSSLLLFNSETQLIILAFYMIWCMFLSSQAARGKMGSNGHEAGIKGADRGRCEVLKSNRFTIAGPFSCIKI